MLVRLLFFALINTSFPSFVEFSLIKSTFGSAASNTLLGILLVTIGTKLKLKSLLRVLQRGGILLVAKFVIGALLGLAVSKLFGPPGFLGISSLALICAITSTNGALYYAITQDLGDEVDTAAVGLLALNNGPFLTMLVLGTTGLAAIDPKTILSMLLPIAIGMLLGNIDQEFGELLSAATPVLTFFLGCSLGAGINLKNVFLGGLSGILLGLITIVCSGLFVVICDRIFNRRPGYAGWAVSATAGNSVAIPAAIALADPSFEPFVANATAQVAAAMILTTILIPIIATWWGKKFGCPKYKK